MRILSSDVIYKGITATKNMIISRLGMLTDVFSIGFSFCFLIVSKLIYIYYDSLKSHFYKGV